MKCLICGREYKSVSTHLKVHGITPKEYKKQFGVDKLEEADVSERRRIHMIGEKNPSKRADVKRKQSETKKGDRNPMKRKEVSQKVANKLRESMKGSGNPRYGKVVSEETRKKIGDKNRGRHPTEETKTRISESMKGEKNPNYGKHISEEQKKILSRVHKGKKNSQKQIEKARETMIKWNKKRWSDPRLIKDFFKAINTKPNKLEIYVDVILQENYPNEYKYNGDFSCGVSIGRLVPDFVNVNGKKIVIEVFGEIFHNPEVAIKKVTWNRQEFGRRAIFSQYGYECVILWESKIRKEGRDYVVGEIERAMKN